MTSQRVFRFAPSPNGRLHLGHACSALLNRKLAEEAGGRLLVRIEDIDPTRSAAEFERGIYEDLAWLGIEWEEPVRRQSGHLDAYRTHLDRLIAEGLVYPAFMSRGDIRAHIADAQAAGRKWPTDPDGAPLYPGVERLLPVGERKRRIESGAPFAWRLDMARALERIAKALSWQEDGRGPMGETGIVRADPALWGDVILARRETPTSYHLSVVVDDAVQGVTDVVRGRDLFHATAIHRLLQELLDLPEPCYFHHDLVLGEDGRKLSKSRGDTALAALRAEGRTPADIRRMVGPGEQATAAPDRP
ncbi:MAG: tRNA glutamyl-Q(34) synthetase GluQRS [Hyphomicrobiales bacterium]|nr:tRNA glutamyl-Q(34) synthetase GluQRS [Hyphomicrobiales bacterium]